MKEFNPIRLSKGEFQISLNLTSLRVHDDPAIADPAPSYAAFPCT
jgi:hypothetical protein